MVIFKMAPISQMTCETAVLLTLLMHSVALFSTLLQFQGVPDQIMINRKRNMDLSVGHLTKKRNLLSVEETSSLPAAARFTIKWENPYH